MTASAEATPPAATLLDAFRALEHALRQHRAREPRLAPPVTRSGAGSRLGAMSASLTAAERVVIHCLDEAGRPVSLSDLAARLHRDPSSVCVTVSRLVTRRLVQKRRSRDDQRRTLLSLTSAGRRWATRSPDRVQAVLADALDPWPSHQVRAATELLAGLAMALTTRTGPTRGAREVALARPMAAPPTPARAPRVG